MRNAFRLSLWLTLLVTAVAWLSQPTFGAIEAVKGKRYSLNKQHGPWMIMVASFRNVGEDSRTDGLNADEAADELVYELRKLGIPAYVFRQEGAVGKINTIDRMGRSDTRIFAAQRGMISVLAGNYKTISPDDPTTKDGKVAQKTLKYVKELNPKMMEKGGRYRPTPGRPGPLSRAFLTINPMLTPEEALKRKNDPLIAQLNAGMDHSLLNNRAKYTLVVKTFHGQSATKLQDSSFDAFARKFDSKLNNSLDQAAMGAWQLTEALRNAKQIGYPDNYEAFVYHDRYQSIVTIGAFDSPNDPRVRQLANMFKGKIKKNPSTGRDFLAAEIFTIPRSPKPNTLPEKSWVFDPAPKLMEVPRVNAN